MKCGFFAREGLLLHHAELIEIVAPHRIVGGLDMHAVAGVFRRQRAGIVVKDAVAVDEEDRFAVGKPGKLRIAFVDRLIFVEGRPGLFLCRMEDRMKKDDRVGLKLAHLLEQHPVLRGPGLRRTGAQLVDAEQNIDLAVAPLCERLSKRQLALRGGEDRLFRRGKDRQPVVAEIACVVQPCVNLEAVNVRIADKKRVVKVACGRLVRLILEYEKKKTCSRRAVPGT